MTIPGPLTLQQLVALDLDLARRRAEAATAWHLAMWGRPPRRDPSQPDCPAADPMRAVVAVWVAGWLAEAGAAGTAEGPGGSR